MCEKCLYKDNCQFLAKHNKSTVDGCTAFKSATDLKSEFAMEIIEYLENNGLLNMTPQGIAALKKKYTEEKV